MDGRSLYRLTGGAWVCGHIQVGKMGQDALGRQFLRTGCPEGHRSGQRLVPSGKDFTTMWTRGESSMDELTQ